MFNVSMHRPPKYSELLFCIPVNSLMPTPTLIENCHASNTVAGGSAHKWVRTRQFCTHMNQIAILFAGMIEFAPMNS